jgi:hypothetical protein
VHGRARKTGVGKKGSEQLLGMDEVRAATSGRIVNGESGVSGTPDTRISLMGKTIRV